jgi:hypothetical protein
MMKQPVDNPVIVRYAFDGTGCARGYSNNFDSSGIQNNQTCDSKSYLYKRTISNINTGGTPVFMRILPIYASTPICVKGPSGYAAFPTQGFVVDSTGFAGSTERRVQVYQGYPRPPVELFPYGLFQP